MNYTLQPYSGRQSRHHCPECGDRNLTFSRYIHTETCEELAPHVGRCDRQDNCGYHMKPSDFFREAGSVYRPMTIAQVRKNGTKKRNKVTSANRSQPETEYYIHSDYVNDSFRDYDKNNLVTYLINRFGLDVADTLVGKYRIGTSSYWHGATIFWQLDTNGYVRTGKIMLYDKQSGKRVKQPFNHINWVHTVILSQKSQVESLKSDADFGLQTQDFRLRQCLFGEHLLITSPYKPVAIVESEKTAIIASALMPAFIWLASGSLQGLSIEKCKVLQNRQVVLFPDVNAYRKWKIKALELRRAMPGTTIVVSDELERMATDFDRKKGSDLGDALQ
ncbi:MAG: hypothetical protein JO080_14905 [Mucilaginibacter sp.]|nr:hypothetical protein [Mucilaginibacter sp.]